MENNKGNRSLAVNGDTTPWDNYTRFLPTNEPALFGTTLPNQPPLNTTTNLRLNNSPSFPDDFPLESAFNGLNLSSDRRGTNWPSFINNGGLGSGSNIGSSNAPPSLSYDPPTPRFSFDDLQRIRAQFAARNHMGTFNPINNHQSLTHYQNLVNNGFTANNNGSLNQMNALYGSNYGGAMNNLQNPRLSTTLNENALVYVPISSRSYNRGNNSPFGADGVGSNSSSNGNSWRNSYGDRNRFNFTSLNVWKGRIRLVTKDRDGCRFLQQKIEEGNPGDFNAIFMELKDHICEMMINPFANDLFNAFIKTCDEEQFNQLIVVVVHDELGLEEICLDGRGTRAMQKLIENVTTRNQKHHLVSALAKIAITLMKSVSGHHVIECCFKFFSDEDVEQILDIVSDHSLEIAINKSGCCVLQTCIIPAALRSKEHIIGELTSNSLILSENPYGNYVVQFILSLRMQHHTSDILRELSGSYVSLSMNKHGSNVVERCLQHSSGDQRVGIVTEIIESSMFLEFVRHPYGNYVAQKIMEFATGNTLSTFVNLILMNDPELHSHPHGKRVLEKAFQQYQRLHLSVMY